MSRWELKWIMSNYTELVGFWLLLRLSRAFSGGVQKHVFIFRQELKNSFLHLEMYTTPCIPKYLAHLSACSRCRNKQRRDVCCVWPDWKNTIRGISCISNLFAHNSAGGDTHSQTHLLITRSKPHTRGPWSPWSPCGRQERQRLNIKYKGQHTLEDVLWAKTHSGMIRSTLIKENNTRSLNYSLWLKVKSLRITWTDMNWVWEREREQWCEVWWVWWGGGWVWAHCIARLHFMPQRSLAVCLF